MGDVGAGVIIYLTNHPIGEMMGGALTPKIISLWWLMQKFDAPGCCSFFAVLGQIAQASGMLSGVGSSPAEGIAAWYGSLTNPSEFMPADRLIDLRENILTPALNFCLEANLTLTARQIGTVCEQLEHSPVRHSEVVWTLVQLKTLMTSEMGDRFFLCISEQQAKDYASDKPMGEAVDETFLAARYDIDEAYKCLALDRNSACVFHSMRIAEHGIRFLAKKLKVKLIHNKKPQPIESATWDKVINAIKNKIAAAHSLPHGKKRQRQLNYYSDMADRCSYMKDLWRNDIMHTRRSFNSDEASGALRRVSDFMRLLATATPQENYAKRKS